jgi:acyl dehydratase
MAEQKVFFEDVSEGDEAPVFSHELTRTNLVQYAGASGDFNPMHHDEIAARPGCRACSGTACSPPGSWPRR